MYHETVPHGAYFLKNVLVQETEVFKKQNL